MKLDLSLCADDATAGSADCGAFMAKPAVSITCAQLCTHLHHLVPTGKTISISQIYHYYQSSINATCDRFTRFDFGM